MPKLLPFLVLGLLLAGQPVSAQSATHVPAPSVSVPQGTVTVLQTRFGALQMRQGLPADAATTQKIYDEMDFQRATQAYLWGLPIVSFAEWQAAARSAFHARDTDIVVYESVTDKLGILTANTVTPYIIGLPDLSKTGPLVVQYPAGPTAGGVDDFWQRPVTDMGLTGPDKGQGGKYLLLGPGQTTPNNTRGYYVIHSRTFNVFVAFRALQKTAAEQAASIKAFAMYPYGKTAAGSTRILKPNGRVWSQMPPRGMAYWQRLDAIIQEEPVASRDLFFMGMLQPLGIEKGKPFKPNQRQTKLLADGAQAGELMAREIAFETRLPGVRYRPDARWETIINFDPVTQATPNYAQFDGRTNYFYQAVATTHGMVTTTPGVGQAYLEATKDSDGNWFDGGQSYRLHLPPNAPAKEFWSVTIYDSNTRCLIDNGTGNAGLSSRQDLKKNGDGSYDIYMGPTAPAVRAKLGSNDPR